MQLRIWFNERAFFAIHSSELQENPSQKQHVLVHQELISTRKEFKILNVS